MPINGIGPGKRSGHTCVPYGDRIIMSVYLQTGYWILYSLILHVGSVARMGNTFLMTHGLSTRRHDNGLSLTA